MYAEYRKVCLKVALLTLCISFELKASPTAAQAVSSQSGTVSVRGSQLMRDGKPWIPHGFYQIAFEVAPGNLARADHPFWSNAYNHYTPDEYTEMRQAGADSVRLQVAQAATDPQSSLYDPAFVNKAIGAVRAARASGLTVMLCVQDESHVPGQTSIDYPDNGTRRIWRSLAREFAGDRGVMFELLNEPRPKPEPRNWAQWKASMMRTLMVVREAGAGNVVIADGLHVGQVIDGAPLLDDPQVVYASHPYALAAQGQTRAMWDAKFGKFSRRAPVIITEWLSGGYYCDADTPSSTVDFIRYLQEKGIGLQVGAWDWTSGGFGSARWGFPNGRFSSFNGLSCHQPGFGLGKVVETWYTTGTPANEPQ